jgi:orotate phosphoribosyltransferase
MVLRESSAGSSEKVVANRETFEGLRKFGALKADETSEYKLKSGRISPYFLNVGSLDTGNSVAFLAKAYARLLRQKLGGFDLLYGIPEKGIPLAIATAEAYHSLYGDDKAWFFTRKFSKTHGEATNAPNPVVGRTPKYGDRVILVDDVFTTGETKYEAVSQLKSISKYSRIAALVIAVDRQEVDQEGKTATQEFSKNTGIPVLAALTAMDLAEMSQETVAKRIYGYLVQYGTEEARRTAASRLEKLLRPG